MNARRTIAILGACALLFLVACVAVAVFFHRQMEVEKNRAKTEPARAKRWAASQGKENESSDTVFKPEETLTKNEVVEANV